MQETESTELNKILKHIQDKIILPTYLPKKQRQIVFDVGKRTYLRENPIVMEVEGHEHTFNTIDKAKDLEPAGPMLIKILGLMNSPGEWENLAIVLAGYKRANIKLSPETRGLIARKAIIADRIDALLECATHADKTGMYIMNKEILTRVLSGINTSSQGGSLKDARKALKQADRVLELVQRREHSDRWVAGTKGDKPHFSLVARMLALFTRAKYVKMLKSMDQDTTKDQLLLHDEALFVSSLYKSQKVDSVELLRDLMELNPKNDRERYVWLKKAMKEAFKNKTARPMDNGLRGLNASGYIVTLAQSMQGLRLTQEILGSGVESLIPLADGLDAHITQFAQETEAQADRKKEWAKIYKTVVGTEPTWQSGTSTVVDGEKGESEPAQA